MASLRHKYIQKICSKGTFYYYYRRGGQRIKIPHDPDTPAFFARYHSIHDSFERKETLHVPGSIMALVVEYRQSHDFKALSSASKRDYLRHLDVIGATFGRFAARSFTRKAVLAYADTMAETPATANYRMAVLRRLFQFGVERDYLTQNPALRPRKFKTGTHLPWTRAQIEAFMKTGKKNLLTAFYLALFTGQRRGDIIRLKWANVTRDRIRVRQQKTGKVLLIPIHTQLKAFLDGLSRPENPEGTVVQTLSGKAFTETHFNHAFRKEADALGLKGVVFHGLRKNATEYLLHGGCTEHEVSSITGMSPQMVRHYALGIEQEKLAQKAMGKLEKSLKL